MKKRIIGLCAALCGLALTANATAYTEANFTASADNTLTLTEDSTLTVDSDISIGKLTVEGSGYTLTLAGSAAVTASSLEIGAGATVQLASGTTLANGALRTSTVTGAGVIGYTGVAPETTVGYTDSDNWTGTVWVQNFQSMVGTSGATGYLDFNSYGNTGSTIRLSGVKGWISDSLDCTVPIELQNNSSYNYGLYLNNGNSYASSTPNSKTVIRTLKGTGAFWADTAGTTSLIQISDDWSDFFGTVAFKNKILVFGDDIPAAASVGDYQGSIVVSEGKTVTIASGKNFIVNKRLEVNGTLNVNGSGYISYYEGTTPGAFITGTGTISYENNNTTPNYGDLWYTNTTWKGTLVVPQINATAKTAIDLKQWGNANSKIALKGIDPVNGTTTNSVYISMLDTPAKLCLDGDVTLTDGSTNNKYTFGGIEGAGNFSVAPISGASGMTFTFATMTNYTGAISANSSSSTVVVKNIELPSIPAPDTFLFNVDESNNNVTLENIKIGEALIVASGVAEMKSDADGYGWYWTAESAPVTAGSDSYASIGAAIAAGKGGEGDEIHVNASLTGENLNIGNNSVTIYLADGVSVSCDSVGGNVANGKLSLKLDSGATSATFAVPVGAEMPQLVGDWIDSGITFKVYGDFGLGDTLFTYGTNGNTFSSNFTVVTDKSTETRVCKVATSEEGMSAIVAGRKYYWVGGASGNWHSAANWQYADGTAASEHPQNQTNKYDGDHVIVTNAATIAIYDAAASSHAKALCDRVTIDADTTFIGGGNYEAYGLFFDVMDGAATATFSNIWIAIISEGSSRGFVISNDIAFVEGTSNYINAGALSVSVYGAMEVNGSLYLKTKQTSGSMYLYGDIAGSKDGLVKLEASYTNSKNNTGGIHLYGDNGGFCGLFDLDQSGSPTAGAYRTTSSINNSGKASSANAIWKLRSSNADPNQKSTFRSGSYTYYFGALVGSYLRTGDSGQQTLVVGSRDDVESSATLVGRGTSSNNSKFYFNVVKVGTNVFTVASGSANLGDMEIAGGTLSLPFLPNYGSYIKFSGDNAFLIMPSYIATSNVVTTTTVENDTTNTVEYTVYPDPSARIKNSTAPIGFDTGAEDFTWATALAASNTGGLTKKGSGTLTLTAAPLCSGPLVVAEGKLVMPPSGANFRNLALGTGATLELDLSGVTADGVLFSAPAAAGTTLTAENVVIKNAASDCSVVINATGSSVAVVKGTGATYTWVGGAKKTVNDEEVDDPAWETAANWQVGGEAASVAPGGLDSVVFNTAEPGFTLAAAVSVMDMTVNAQGFAFAADFALSVLGDMTVSTPGALAISGTGSLDVNGVASGITSVTMTPTTATSTIINAHPYYTERFTVGADLALTSLDGAGTISSDADQTVTIAENATSTFYGSFTGDMSLTKSGKGTLALQGPSDFTGDLFINEGTLALSAYDYTSYVKFDFDAMNTNNWTTTESDGRIYVTRLKTRTGGCSSGQLSYSYFQDISSGAAYPELVEDSDYFGGRPCVKVSDGVQMAYQDSKSVRARAYGWMFVYQKNDTPSANKNLLTGGNSSGNDYLTLRPSGSWYAHRYYSDISDYLYSDGENDATFTAGKKSVISIPYSVAENDNRYEILDGAFNGVVAQMIGFSPAPPLEVRAAIETYLMQKWGCDAAIDNQYLPKTAHVTMAAGATLDLGGMTQTVKSFTGAGTVQNGTLKTADNTVTVTGDLTIPVTDDTTYVIDNSMKAVKLTLIGTATGVTIEVSQTNNPVKVVTPAMNIKDEVTINVPAKWANYKTYSENGCTIGRLPFVIRIR